MKKISEIESEFKSAVGHILSCSIGSETGLQELHELSEQSPDGSSGVNQPVRRGPLVSKNMFNIELNKYEDKIIKILIPNRCDLLYFESTSMWRQLERRPEYKVMLLASGNFWQNVSANLKGSYRFFQSYAHNMVFYEIPEHYCPIKKTLMINNYYLLHRIDANHPRFSVLDWEEPEASGLNQYFEELRALSVRVYPLQTLGL